MLSNEVFSFADDLISLRLGQILDRTLLFTPNVFRVVFNLARLIRGHYLCSKVKHQKLDARSTEFASKRLSKHVDGSILSSSYHPRISVCYELVVLRNAGEGAAVFFFRVCFSLSIFIQLAWMHIFVTSTHSWWSPRGII